MKFFIQKAGAEIGPFSIAHINRMHNHHEISRDTLCRREDTKGFRPIGELFPHLKAFKSGGTMVRPL